MFKEKGKHFYAFFFFFALEGDIKPTCSPIEFKTKPATSIKGKIYHLYYYNFHPLTRVLFYAFRKKIQDYGHNPSLKMWLKLLYPRREKDKNVSMNLFIQNKIS